MSRNVKQATAMAAKDRVVSAAREYIAELENPVADMLRRASLRQSLKNSIESHDRAVRVNSNRKDPR